LEEQRSEDARGRWAVVAPTVVAVQERRQLLRSGIVLILGAEDDIDVAGAAPDADGVRAVVDEHPVDTVILEIKVEAWDVAELVRDLRGLRGGLLVIGLYTGRRSDHLSATKGAGIDVLLPVSAGTTGLLASVRGSEAVLHPGPSVDRRVLPGREVLTPREQEVLRHISAGLTTQQSALLLEVSPKTVDNHKQRMFAKLGVQNQAHAVAVAHRAGILRPEHPRAFGA
jgi:DNA-binding NarL/FixJ family response regulator